MIDRSAIEKGFGVAVASLLMLVLAGCNSQEVKPTTSGNQYAALGDPSGNLMYATAMPSGSAAESIMRGDSALMQGDEDRALFEYLGALQLGGPNVDVLYKIARIHLAKGDRDRARLALVMALERDQKHPGVLLEIGVLQMHARDFDNARQYLGQAIEVGGNAARARNALGVLEDMEGNFDAAQQHYMEAIRIAGKVPVYLNNLGYSLYLDGDAKKAEQWFRAALAQDAAYNRAWRNLGLVYAKSGRYQEAIEAFRKAGGGLHEAYNDVGYIAMVAGRLDDADRFFEEAIRLSPTFYRLADENAQRLAVMRGGQGRE